MKKRKSSSEGVLVMSKYTTEVRFICEDAVGLNESVGYMSVNEVIAGACEKVFDFDYPIFDESYRRVLEKKILKHYYTREIGEETVGLWKLRLDMKLNEIMPFYNKLYNSELIKIDPMLTSKMETKRKTEFVGNGKSDSESNGKSNSTDKYSDTPQGGLTGVIAGNYLTNARVVNDDNENKGKVVSYNDSTEDYVDSVIGHSGISESKLLKEFRDTFLNIDVMIISDLEELFMSLW